MRGTEFSYESGVGLIPKRMIDVRILNETIEDVLDWLGYVNFEEYLIDSVKRKCAIFQRARY
jgi:hypothetical protein